MYDCTSLWITECMCMLHILIVLSYYACLKDKILDPLCLALKEDLRLSSHLALKNLKYASVCTHVVLILLYACTASYKLVCSSSIIQSRAQCVMLILIVLISAAQFR